MGTEIERRFLVKSDSWRTAGQAKAYRQGYLSVDPARTVRVRIVEQSAWLTLKAQISDISRHEFEYPIPWQDGMNILNEMCPEQICKERTKLEIAGHIWEVDEFFGMNQGLVLAEIELANEDTPFVRPDWLGEEVTHDGRYTNAWLSGHPFASWAIPPVSTL